MLPKILSLIALLFIIAAPFAVFADGFPPTPIVPPCQDEVIGQATKACGFNTLMHLIRHLIDFALFLAMPIAAGLFAFAGILYVTSSANPGNIGRAHGIFSSVFIGLLWVLGAWLVITLISDALLKPDYIRL